MQSSKSTFHIRREDIAVDAIRLVTDGLLIGSVTDCDLLLNHPSVSHSHAGIKQLNGDFYIFNLSPTTATTLNGKLVETPQVLATGDTLQIGPFFLAIEREGAALTITVSLQIGLHIGELNARASELSEVPIANEPITTPNPEDNTASANPLTTSSSFTIEALDLFWQKRQREAGKMERRSPLHPRGERRLGKVRYNWKPTSDLAPRRSKGIFLWSVLIITLFSIGAAYLYASAYSPAPVSNPHTRAQFALTPAVAREPNANSCTTCHSLTRSMDESCASCHKTETFASHTMKEHADAGINCTACHAEHRGADFRPRLAALASCAECHNDNNKNLYNGRSVHTAHGGIVGYPVEAGQWTWKGIDDETWAKRFMARSNGNETQAASFQIAANQLARVSANERRSIQFHQLHLHRIRLVPGLTGNADGEVSCSTCHKTSSPIDRETPRTTCAACHNGKQDAATGVMLISQDKANCTSCHIQHREDKRHWNPSLLADRSGIVMQTPNGTAPNNAESNRTESNVSARRISLPRSL